MWWVDKHSTVTKRDRLSLVRCCDCPFNMRSVIADAVSNWATNFRCVQQPVRLIVSQQNVFHARGMCADTWEDSLSRFFVCGRGRRIRTARGRTRGDVALMASFCGYPSPCGRL